jgi:hypothetical protein
MGKLRESQLASGVASNVLYNGVKDAPPSLRRCLALEVIKHFFESDDAQLEEIVKLLLHRAGAISPRSTSVSIVTIVTAL